MEKKVRVAVVGMGNMGRGHAANMICMPEVDLVALCDEYSASAEKYKEEQGIDVQIYSDFYKMIEEIDLDAVYICLPPFCHNGQVEAAAEKKIAVFIEKPIALDVVRGEAMAKAVIQNNIVSQVGYQMRFGNAVQRFRELIESGASGKLTLFTASYECNSLHGPWWRDKEKCGGQVFEQVIHLYDMAQYLMGVATDVSGRVANLAHRDVPGYTVEDTSVANMTFESGALGCITGSNCAVKEQWNARFRVVCENLVADFEDQNHGKIIYTDEHEGSVEIINGKNNVTKMEDQYFIDAVLGKREPFATIPEGFSDLKLVSSVVASSENNGAVVEI
ncbi:MAG: Gfo/Idh/MocA family protein [Lachnospiraceae bacterium]